MSVFINHYIIKHPVSPVTDIDHLIERHSLFTIVVLGEVFSAILFSRETRQYDRSDSVVIFGMVIAICIQFIYFTTDQENASF